jgi:homoserine kinase
VIVVRVPASSANIGPGFDALGMALTMYAEVGVGAGDDVAQPGVVADARHPAAVAFRRAGGHGGVWVRSPIPVGRGLGYSGAMRVGGLVAAAAQRGDGDPAVVVERRAELLAAATELEGHADNVAASLVGGVVATAAGGVVRVPLALDPAVVVWIPPSTTSTAASRTALPPEVSFDDAVFNIGRAALLVAALAAGDVDALRGATADRLHQDRRLAAAAASRAALAAGVKAGAWCGWLSGSGPSIAFLCAEDDAAALAAALPASGHTKLLRIDTSGATVAATD